MHHPVVKAGLELSAISAVFTYWVGILPAIVGFLATLASLAWYSYCLYDAIRNKRNRSG